jgi:calcium-dependent protein kinase
MELCSGGDLESRQKSYTEQEVSKIIQQVLSAASYLHERNIVHRDFKLENILFVDPEQLDVKIIDFGVAKKYATKKERHYERYGTLYTMSPEAIKGSYTGSSTDLWSIGVIAYILLCKKKPFNGKNTYVSCLSYITIRLQKGTIDCVVSPHISFPFLVVYMLHYYSFAVDCICFFLHFVSISHIHIFSLFFFSYPYQE